MFTFAPLLPHTQTPFECLHECYGCFMVTIESLDSKLGDSFALEPRWGTPQAIDLIS